MADEPKIKGCIHTFDDGREVFVGHRDPGDGTYFVRFRNKDGDDTLLKLSPDAFNVLFKMKEACDRGGKPYWQVVHRPDTVASAT